MFVIIFSTLICQQIYVRHNWFLFLYFLTLYTLALHGVFTVRCLENFRPKHGLKRIQEKQTISNCKNFLNKNLLK